MKSFLRWIRRHKGISIAILVILLIIPFIVRNRVKKSNQGTLTPPIQRGNIIEGVYGIGTVMANQSFQLQTGVTNLIREIFVKEGDFVKKGEPLISIEGNVSRAPFSGVVTYLPVKVGEVVYMQSSILTLTDLKDRYLVVSLEQEGAIRVKPGQKARLNFESIRDASYEGIVQSVYSQNNNFLARIDIANLPSQILPGMTADVAIGISEKRDALLVPLAALESGHVYLKSSLKPKKIPVKTGIIDGVKAEILSGAIKAGDQLLIRTNVGQ